MSQFERWALALARTEQNMDSLTWLNIWDHTRQWKPGDSGFAWGPWQIHPEWVRDYMPTKAAEWRRPWVSFLACCLQRFYERLGGDAVAPLRLAMTFHCGIEGVERGEWDVDYQERFSRMWAVGTAEIVKQAVGS